MLQRSVVGWWSLSRIGANSVKLRSCWDGTKEPRCIRLKPTFGANLDCETRQYYSPSIFNITTSASFHHHYIWILNYYSWFIFSWPMWKEPQCIWLKFTPGANLLKLADDNHFNQCTVPGISNIKLWSHSSTTFKTLLTDLKPSSLACGRFVFGI